MIRVVIVEDNYDANVALSRLLEKSGFEVAGRAYDGLAGLETIKSTKPDVAMDGLGLATRIRKEMQLPPRLVALTSFAKELESDAMNAGFDAYLRKPADWPTLRAALEKHSAAFNGRNIGLACP
jgi:CheY-like chemotaxis protein